MINWQQYHQSRASFFRDTAATYRSIAEKLAPTDPDLADFSLQRAATNEDWAVEADGEARDAGNHFVKGCGMMKLDYEKLLGVGFNAAILILATLSVAGVGGKFVVGAVFGFTAFHACKEIKAWWTI